MLWVRRGLGNAWSLPDTLANRFKGAYFGIMFEFCIPTRATSVPVGPDWFHEIKYDGVTA
jgi:ATP-dependent DNA ligase